MTLAGEKSGDFSANSFTCVFIFLDLYKYCVIRRRHMKTLKEAKIGQTVKVVKLHGEGPIKRRIMDMLSLIHI